MSYTKTNWVNGSTPLSADNMNHIETGIKDAHDDLATLTSNVYTKSEVYTKAESDAGDKKYIDPTNKTSYSQRIGTGSYPGSYSITATSDCFVSVEASYPINADGLYELMYIILDGVTLFDVFVYRTSSRNAKVNYLIPVKSGQVLKFEHIASQVDVSGYIFKTI